MAGARPGSIYRIALENFVTYKQVELFPGPNLNLVIGPNGTGKSTFICAIVLGLCGKTKVIGRAKKIGEFVKSGCTEATIEIELFRNSNERRVIITRNFNIENTSVWSIDKKQTKEKQVQDLISSLNIRVDNLCQLLPQDRVQDFAKMNSQELLKSTQLAVTGQEAVSLLEELIENKMNHRSVVDKLKSSSQQLLEYEQINARLAAVIKSIDDMKKIKIEIDMCEKKKIWAEYEQLKKKVDELTKDKTKAVKLFKTWEDNMKPFNKDLLETQEENKQLENKKRKAMSSILILKSKISKLLEESEVFVEKIAEKKNDWQNKLLLHTNKRRDIEQAKATLTKMQNDRDNLINTFGDETKLKNDMAENQKPIREMDVALSKYKNKKIEIQHEIESRITSQIRLYQSKLNALGDASKKRLEVLKVFNDHTYKALLWLRDNREIFVGNVYEPMLLELNFADSNYAKYIENTVAARDLIAFTFENSDDMNLFLKKVRTDLNLKMVNAVCSSPSNQMYSPPISIDRIRHLGFSTYLVDVISGPDAIIQFLCKQYGLHKIPIGNDTTYKRSQDVPSEISFFYSENHRFTIRVSAYSGAKSTSTNEIRPAKLLANNIDQDAIDYVKSEIEELSTEQQTKMKTLHKTDADISRLESKLNSLYSRRQTLHESLDQVKTILSRIRMQQNKITNMENEPHLDVEKETEIYKSSIENCVINQCDIQNRIFLYYEKLYDEITAVELLGMQLSITYNFILETQNKLAEMKSQASKLEQTLSNINNQLTNVKTIAKEKLSEAKHATGKFLPHEPGFPYVDEFSKLPSDFNSIQEHLAMLQARIDCMDNMDDQVIEEYRNSQKEIKRLTTEIKEMQNRTQNREEIMNNLKSRWLEPLEKQIIEINKKFSDMFAQLGCAGEVRLLKGGAEDDYDMYGISILVRFREEENLQQLTQHIQSGGERALTTALYLMALQQLSKAPFRCVDEINQGMDPINERKMFQLLVKITTECDASSQYFLLTPKLLYGLEYSPSIKVHTIMNGPKIVKYNKWNFNKFISNAHRLAQS